MTDPYRLALDAIDLFLEYRDRHGYSEERARAAAALECQEADAEPAEEESLP